MDAAFTEEQDQIRRTLRALLRERCDAHAVKAAVRTAPGHDGSLWRLLARRPGLPGLALPEAYGGVGCGSVELALACEEAGRALLPSPLLATAVLTAPLLARLGTDAQCAELLPRIVSGELTAALAVPGGALPEALGLTGTRAEAAGGTRNGWAGGGRAGGVQARHDGEAGWRLYGQVEQVLDGHSAGLLLVAAHAGGCTRGRTLLFLVRGEAAGLTRTRLTALDETRPQARIELRDVAAQPLGGDPGRAADGDPERAVDGLVRLGVTAAAQLAAEAVGVADAALAHTVAYVREREQFGRPIGSFQAVKHRLADVYVRVQAARSAAYYAAWATDRTDAPDRRRDDHEAAVAGGLALAQALEAQRAAAAEAVQLHGGIGFTWEHDAHLAFKRAASDELLFGPVHRLRACAAERDGLFGVASPSAASRTAVAV
ncbi:acyl-CoA dehydrogenase family protein [Streptomyces coffeae]|uniref:Acyl-CoA dehydrogenase family protein n=1 Tax=Streptomyces coffeae TaxID=621382 RepID=A0ABS1NH19_9ACTN|nr:acyl-CoA dehydrogenase family protein [Streptomyces coffeae]MBL1099407.1 acyl-CoA dehydrogenase family protein [Streptomyces coffeae]